MARQECNNTFSDGLMMDLNPINTPKSVLTDCLNGTYITYNGNEFVLQNDMGNYKLKNCKLPTNFIPVGVKGYGDILYIVSYNPITKETEIGSYPAPQSIFTTGDSEALLASEDDLAPFVWGPGTEIQEIEVEYPTIIRTNKKPIFIFSGGTDEETYKLNPGDEFRFSGELTSLAFIYQHLNFYIIDEDNKLYDIDDTQIYNENGSLVSNDTMRKVFWETPGWLAAQYDLYVPDRFNLNLRSLNVPEFLVAQSDEASSQTEDIPLDELQPDEGYFKVSMDLSSQTIITDKLFQTELDKHFGNELANTYDHLYIRYLIKRNIDPPNVGKDDYGTFKGIIVSLDDTHTQDYTNGVIEGEYVYYDIPVWKHNYQDDIITAYNNVRPIWFCKNPDKNQETGDLDIANYHGVVELTAYPIIKYNNLTLKYTQFSTTQRFPLNTLKNSSNITIANQIYKWSVDDDSCTISFNINGPFINASDITGRYEIYRINFNDPNNPTISDAPECFDTISNLVLYGQNTINIDWDEEFQKDNSIYILKITLEQNNQKLHESSLLLIPSVIFNEWFGELDNYLDSITAPMWIQKYVDYINITSVNLNEFIIEENNSKINNWLEYKWSDESTFSSVPNNLIIDDIQNWIKELFDEKYNNGSDYYNSSIRNSTYLQLKINYNKLLSSAKINGEIKVNSLKGNLWNSEEKCIYTISSVNNQFLNVDKDLNIDFSDYYQIINITSTQTDKSIYREIGEAEYPFRYNDNSDNIRQFRFYNYSSGDSANARKTLNTSVDYYLNDSDYRVYGSWDKTGREKFYTDEWCMGICNTYLTEWNKGFALGYCRADGHSDTTSSGNHYKKVFTRGNTSNGQTIIANAVDSNIAYGLILRAKNYNGTQKACIWLQFGNDSHTAWIDNQELINFIKALYLIKLIKYSTSPETIYNTILQSSASIELSLSNTFTKLNLLYTLNKLSTDNLILYPNTNLNVIFNSQNIKTGSLLKGDTSNIIFQKELRNISLNPSLTLSITWNNSNLVSLSSTLSSAISNLNKESSTKLENLQNVTEGGTHISYDSVTDYDNNDLWDNLRPSFISYTNKSKWDLNLNDSELRKLTEKITTLDGQGTSTNTICYDNSTNEYVIATTYGYRSADSTDRVDNSPSISWNYFQQV